MNSLGVSLITKASLGTSPITSIPYVLSLSFPFTLGNFTIFFSVFLILLQLLILRKNFKLEHVLQIPISIIFGYFIDLTMLLFTWVNPQTYIMKIVYLLIGCLILGFGVYMEVLADVVMLPGESFVRAIVLTWRTNFGTTKICFDVSMAVIAAVLSFVLPDISMVCVRVRSLRHFWLDLLPEFLVRNLHLSEKDATHKIQKKDKQRADNYHYYIGRI